MKRFSDGDYDKATQELVVFADIPADKMTIRDREGHDLYYYASAKNCRIKGDYIMYGFYLDMIPNACPMLVAVKLVLGLNTQVIAYRSYMLLIHQER